MNRLKKIPGLFRVAPFPAKATIHPWLAVALSFWLPGLGHFQLGAYRTGMTLIAAWSLVTIFGAYEFWGTDIALSRIDIGGWLAMLAVISLAGCIGSYRRAKEAGYALNRLGRPVRTLSLALISPFFRYFTSGHRIL